jgi:hypothetical protein
MNGDGRERIRSAHELHAGQRGETMPRLTDESYRRIHESLTGFGYRVGLAMVTDETNHLLDGGKARNVIGMFIENQLRKANLLPKAREANQVREAPTRDRGRS